MKIKDITQPLSLVMAADVPLFTKLTGALTYHNINKLACPKWFFSVYFGQ